MTLQTRDSCSRVRGRSNIEQEGLTLSASWKLETRFAMVSSVALDTLMLLMASVSTDNRNRRWSVCSLVDSSSLWATLSSRLSTETSLLQSLRLSVAAGSSGMISVSGFTASGFALSLLKRPSTTCFWNSFGARVKGMFCRQLDTNVIS